MNEIVKPSRTIALPSPRVPISIRVATLDDLAFIDALQKKHTKQVGFMPTKQFEGKIRAGHVLVAWASRPCTSEKDMGETPMPLEERVGYLIGNDQYFKRDDVGIIYQINIAEGIRRSLVGATLLKAQFERSAYGCKLYCCWCAQDIEANRFWESMVSSRWRFARAVRRSCACIFSGRGVFARAMRRPRFGFPGRRTAGAFERIDWCCRFRRESIGGMRCLACRRECRPAPALPEKRKRSTGKMPVPQKIRPALGRLQFVVPKQKKDAGETPTPRKKQKNDPKLVAAARELRDRWLERVNDDPAMLQGGSQGKYEVSRLIESTSNMNIEHIQPTRLLAA